MSSTRVGVRANLDELQRVGSLGLWLRGVYHDTPGFTASLMVHAAVLLLLALITIVPPVEKLTSLSLLTPTEDTPPVESPELSPTKPTETTTETNVNLTNVVDVVQPVETPAPVESPVATLAAPAQVELSTFGDTYAPKHFGNRVGTSAGKGLDGRTAGNKASAFASVGCTTDTERAVGEALAWLAAHQMHDGGWSCNHGVNNGHIGPVNNPGSEQSRTAATALALLPFLGAGQTHREGKYEETVQRGLYFLCRQMKAGGDLRGEGSLYAHGLAAIVLSEAYGMTQDKALATPAQSALDFITKAQDKTGGGWRYQPGQPGDTSVVGWQVMALKSGHMAYLNVPPQTVAGAIHFLNLVQSNQGAQYGYTGAGSGPATTAVGLLCRMYLGWKRDNPALIAGVRYLSEQGPSKTNMYFNYYAAQVLRHWEGEEWKAWNQVMKDQLVGSQVQRGTYSAEKGSWYTPGQAHGERGGRLYETSLSTLTLEVYYRHMPIFRKQAAEQDF